MVKVYTVITYYTTPSVPYNTLFLNPVASKQAYGLRPFPSGR